MNAIEVTELTKSFGKTLAVDHISFTVNDGEVFGFLGPNGAGKTTTIRMLTGLTSASHGRARIFGFDIRENAREAKGQMGIVPEDSNVYTDLTAWDNLIFSGELYGISKSRRERNASELLGLLGLAEKKDEKVRGFSKGMKRRLTIAMALLSNPRILFLDEPTSGLDVQSALLIKAIVRKMNRDGVTVFMTTHNIEEANVMCDRVAIIDHGRIVALDRPEALKRTIESAQSIEVAFGEPLPSDEDEMMGIASVIGVKKIGDKMKLFTDNPPATLAGVWQYANINGRKIISINTLGPSLEDVFLRITGIQKAIGRSGEGVEH